MDGNEVRQPWFLSLRAVAVYLAFSIVWIPATDLIVELLARDQHQREVLGLLKGWLFVSMSAGLLYLLIVRTVRQARGSDHVLAEQKAQIDLILQQVPVILWVTDRDLKVTSTAGGGLASVGRKANQVRGLTLSEATGAIPDRERVLDAARSALTGETTTYTLERDGRAYETTVVPLRSQAGAIEGVLGLAVDITDAKRVRDDLLASNEALRAAGEQRNAVVRHLVKVEQEERERIASGIHDDTIQVMTSAAMALDLMIQKLSDESGVVEIAGRARELMAEAIKRLRTLTFDLKPVELDRDGLGAGLRLLLERYRNEADFDYEMDDKVGRELEPHLRYILYRIAAEAIHNARRHARANHINVVLRPDGAGVTVSVSDDGVGFDVTSEGPPAHFGLSDMRERAELAGGTLRIDSEIGEGTQVVAWVPLAVETEVKGAVGI